MAKGSLQVSFMLKTGMGCCSWAMLITRVLREEGLPPRWPEQTGQQEKDRVAGLDAGGRDHESRDAGDPERLERASRQSPLETPGRAQSCQHGILGDPCQTSDPQTRKRINTFVLPQVTKFGVICYSSNGNTLQCQNSHWRAGHMNLEMMP